MQKRPSLDDLANPLRVGSTTLCNRVLLAPMSGVTDRPFREIAWAFGAGAVVSEMIASDQLAAGDPVAASKAQRAGGPHIVQLAGREAHWMAEGARAATDSGADIVDINMGCPAKKVTGGYSGSALMRDLDHALSLIEATVRATELPVTLKMRLGWDDASLNAAELATRAEKSGVQAVTVHGRTRCQFYKGKANWNAIAEVVDTVSIPVIVNGDIDSAEAAAAALAKSGASAVMVGRGSYGRPWLPGHLALMAHGRTAEAPSGVELAELVKRHYDAMLGHYGVEIGLRAARKHLDWYLEGAGPSHRMAVRREMLTSPNPDRVCALIDLLFDGNTTGRAAA